MAWLSCRLLWEHHPLAITASIWIIRALIRSLSWHHPHQQGALFTTKWGEKWGEAGLSWKEAGRLGNFNLEVIPTHWAIPSHSTNASSRTQGVELLLTSYWGRQTRGIKGSLCFHGLEEMKKSKWQFVFSVLRQKCLTKATLGRKGFTFGSQAEGLVHVDRKVMHEAANCISSSQGSACFLFFTLKVQKASLQDLMASTFLVIFPF